MISTCPDETTLAAFVDGGLAPSAHEAVVTHVSDCARCAELLSVEARASVQGTPQALDPALLARARFYRATFALTEALDGLRDGDQEAYRRGMESYLYLNFGR